MTQPGPQPPKVQTKLFTPEFVQRLERLAVTAKRVQLGALKGERKSKRRGSSTEFADYRDYVQGDDLRHVDWNIYARLGVPYLKLFQDQEDLTLHVLIDASASMGYGSPPKLEQACKLAGALGYIALAGYDGVSVGVLSDGQVATLPNLRGRAAARRLFPFLESVSSGGQTHLADACRSYVVRQRRRGAAVLLSDFLEPGGFEEALRKLEQSRCDCHALHLLAPEEIEPRMTGDLRLVDSEYETYTEISVTPALFKRYRKNVAGFRESIRQFCMRRGMGHAFVPSNMPLEDAVFGDLRKGGLLR